MNYSLILIGAHDGTKTEDLIRQASDAGPTLLIEPVPWLFEKLRQKYSAFPSIHLCDSVIAETDSEVVFYAPIESANEIQPIGDQLGSLNPTHATQHDPKFFEKIIPIKKQSLCFETLFNRFDVSGVDTLITDTEGHDAIVLSKFPFLKFKPRQILFEHKHSDGVFNIGKNFAHLLVLLEAFGYKTKIVDGENCLATLRE